MAFIKRKTLLSAIIAVFCLTAAVILPFTFLSAADDTPLPEQPATTVSIASSDELITYSREYARGGHNPNDVIQLALSSGTSFVLPSGDDGYIPIGNNSRPFNGKLEIADNAVGSFMLETPLFGAVTTDAKIVNASGVTREIQIARLSEADAPLFADSVVGGVSGAGAEWKATLKADDRDSVNKTAHSFAGVIGSVADNCEVSFEFTHDSVSSAGAAANAASAGNLGLICCSLGEGAVLNVKIISQNDFSIISSGGHAGGVVGVMADGATLNFLDDYSSPANVSSGSGKYAGALVGYAENADITVESGHAVNLSKTVTGGAGAGGLYGYYKSSGADRAFELENYTSDASFTIAGGTDVGIVAGFLDAETNVEITDSGANLTDSVHPKQVRFTGGSYRGGLIGKYKNSSLTNSLEIHDAEVRVVTNSGSVTYSGGAIGRIDSGAAYVSFGDFRLDASASVGGGLIGSAGTDGSFIDVDGTVDINGSVGAGLVDRLNAGVLRIAGVTDLSGASYSAAQIVRTRSNALIYALGSGSDASWTFKRGSGTVDDVADWGEVLRLGSANGLSESDFFTVDMTAHTVTVAGHVQNMATVKDFIKTALNIQLNDQDRGALLFSSSSRSSAILASDLSITADIDLGGTGVSELTRDNGDSAAYTGTFDGNGHKITLAIGEPYGMSGSTALTAPSNIGDNNYGTIIDHHYLGLFAKTTNATVNDLAIDGYISSKIFRSGAEYKIGSVAASVSGSDAPLTLSGVETSADIRVYANNGSVYAGGAVGYIDAGTSGVISVSDCVFGSVITEKTYGAHGDNVGGAIGYVASTSALTLDFDRVTVAGTYSDTVSGSSYYTGIHYGGLIGFIAPNSGNFTRNVTINDLTVGDGASITVRVAGSDRSASAGGFLGNEWYDTNVTIGTEGASDGVTIGGTGTAPSITVSASGGSHPTASALVAKATGHWVVNHVAVNRLNVTASNTSGFGFIVGDGIRHNNGAVASALYLDLVSDGFDIAATTMNGNFDVYDEVVGYSAAIGSNIEDNGAAVVSIRTAGGDPLIMSGSGCNTYQNQTSYGKNTKTTNANTRYYYNLDLIRNKGSNTDAEKLLLWSLNKYASSYIRNNGYFSNGYNNRISGNCDMAGLSYYPVDASGVTISNATVKFYNDEIETGESAAGDSDGVSRSTRDNNPRAQHYMMHEGLFRNYSGSMTVNGLHIAGNVSNRHGGNASGFLVCGMLGDTNDTSRITIRNLVLDGARIVRTNAYSPLLINKIGKNVKLELTGVTATVAASGDAYPAATVPVASSLIGDVGSDTAININLAFEDIKLDARTAEGGLSGLTSAYGTSRSIFDRATLLNSFRFLNGSLGEYNYTHDDDWTGSAHRVTYGKEVTSSVEYAGREDHYYDDSTHYTHPTDSSGAAAYDFSTGFLPYVYAAYDANDLYHEIKVNVKDVNLTSGCGQYNDPYVITDGAMLATAAKIISGAPDTGVEIQLPTDVGSEDMWCASGSAHAVYVYNGSNFVLKSDGSDPKSLETVRTYLAGAYYSIAANQIELPATFVGFGALSDWSSNDYECKYAFRGVIIGNRNIIQNHSANPLIRSANGCVVKDVTVTTDATITISQSNVVPFRYDSLGCASYGAVIGQVMGGDNIIDHVSVGFTGPAITADSTACRRLVPVGGYVGVIVNGGVIFRNMDGDVNAAGLTSAECALISDDGWLYVNPIIGRVIAGYAFNEADGYAPTSTKLANGEKNYVIPDLDPNGSKLSVTASAANNHVISVPDAQSLYVLSCIVNSGAGGATYNGNTEQAYAEQNGTPWMAYREWASTRCAEYDEVGASAASDGDYADVAAKDRADGNTKIPYIIRRYTVSAGTSLYRARSIAGGSTVASVTLSSGTYEMTGGFRGINSIYTNSNYNRIQLRVFDGADATVDLAMDYREYNQESGNQNSKTNTQIENYKPFADAGFGLFNVLYQSSASDTNSIKDLTLTGSVFYDIRKLSDGSNIKYAYGWHNYNNLTGYYPDVADRIESTGVLHTGGVAGASANAAYIKDVTLDGLAVEGAKYTGGYIGYVKGKNVTVISPATEDLRVTAGFVAGGVIGGFYSSGDLTVKGTSSETAVIDIDAVTVKGEPSCAKIDFKDFSQMFHAEGGICGFASSGTSKTVTVQYLKINGGVMTATQKMKRPSDMRYKVLAGGMFGRLESSKIAITDSSVEGVNIDANTCGGLIGCSRDTLSGNITDVSVKGGSGLEINATNMVGGLIGYYFGGNGLNLNVSGYTVEDYVIISSEDTEKASAGGLIGTLTTTSSSVFNIHDSVIRNCTVSRCATFLSGDANLIGVGGWFGAVSANTGAVTGHDLLLDGVSVVNASGNRAPGTFIGTNNGNSVKLVGVTATGGTVATVHPVGVNNNTSVSIYGSNGYIILADHDAVSAGASANENGSSLFASPDLVPAYPFVTYNPITDIGSSAFTLTGHGAAATVADLPIQEIIAGEYLYEFATSYRSQFNVSKLSTYNYEQSTAFTDDFAVLIVDDVSRLNTTNMINAYLNLLSGTRYDYTANVSKVYSVNVYKMVYDEGEGKFVKSNEAANLKRDGGQFYMNIDSVDTAGNMFSLIDVAFYDPASTSDVAYHLYVPVLVKKMLTFDFVIATGTGTNYERAWYDDRFGDPLMENLGTPASLFFKYSYLRSHDEWEAAVNNGENLMRNYAKTLTLSKSGAIPDLPASTILVLVDTNNGGKPYYARFGSVYSAGVLSLSGFRETLDDNSSAAFTPVNLVEFLDLTATANADGSMVVCDESSATVKAKLGGADTFFRLATDADSALQHYSIAVGNTDDASGVVPIEEPYYVSFFTESSESNAVYHYTISAPSSFNDPANPSRIADADKLQNREGTVHLILGNIFVQTGTTLSTLPNNTEMSILTGNRVLTVNMESTVTLAPSLKSEVQGYLGAGSGINVFHSFVLRLTRTDETGSIKIIADSPTVGGSYQISSANGAVAATDPSDRLINVLSGYAEVSSANLNQNINEYLVNGNGAVITSTVTLDYATSLSDQFPNREDPSDTSIGTTASCSSNIAYYRAGTSYSKIAKNADDSAGHSYYCKINNKSARLHYNVRSDVFVGDVGPLGINPLDDDYRTEVSVSTLAIYDILDIKEAAVGYDTVKITLSLFVKTDGYAIPLSIPTYMPYVAVAGFSAGDAGYSENKTNPTEYVFTLPRAALEAASALDTSLEITIDYRILTGTAFEALGLDYSNYKIFLTAELLKSSDPTDRLVSSQADDYLIYTNARILPVYID